MEILCASITHHTTPVELREKFAVGRHELASVLNDVRALDGVNGALIVSTCNRVEYYVAGPGPSKRALREFLDQRTGVEAAWKIRDTERSARHLFRVACGLDSMVLGENEILGQLRRAYASAVEAGTTNGELNQLFQHAFRAARHARMETLIGYGATSIGSIAAKLASQIFKDLAGHRVMILGAGEISERTARCLVAEGVETVFVSNRSYNRAAELASEIGGRAIPYDHWPEMFADVDILISSTTAPHVLLTREKVEPRMRLRNGRPLFMIDLAVPRDIAPEVGSIEGVHLYDIDSFESIARESLGIRRSQVAHCLRMINDHVAAFMSSWAAGLARPD